MSVELKPISKEELIIKLHSIEKMGWIENTTRTNNDGAAGNKLEDLLGIPENNLPIPNAAEWELKTQRDNTSSLLTLFHMEPSPQALTVVPSILLPNYGWPHKNAGTKYPLDEKSFRATLNALNFTRGFSVYVNDQEQKIEIIFDPQQVNSKDQDWLENVRQQTNNFTNQVMPYWGFDDLFSKARGKLLNCFFVIAETQKENGKIFFHYYKVYMLKNLNIYRFIDAIRSGFIFIDFDARTGHNHGTKFRINPTILPSLYEIADIVIDAPKLKDK